MSDLKKAKECLLTAGYTCVLQRESRVLVSRERGVKPLVSWLDSGEDLRGFSAADKVVGKATAYLYVLLRVKAVYAAVISEDAAAVLETHGISCEYDTRVSHIINRRGDGCCPFEEATAAVTTPEDALTVIRRTMKALGIA